MKTLTLLKILTLGLAAAIIAGLCLLTYKITDSSIKSNPRPIVQSTLELSFPETVTMVTACGDRLCLMTAGHESGRRLIIVDPARGRASAILTLTDQPE